MNPNDFASMFMLTAGAMLFVGGISGLVFGLFWRWFLDKPKGGDRKVK